VSHHCAGCSTTAGMAGCPEHGGHSWSSSQVVITHCQHGLDLRIHPRCYLCEPAATPAPLDVGPRLMAAVRAVIADGIDSPGVHNELHAAYYEARDHATPAPLDVLVAARAVVDAWEETVTATVISRTNWAIERLRYALAATPAPLAPHPGQNHDYRMTCLRCGEPGYLFVGFHSPGETFNWSEAQPKEAE